MKVRLGVTNLEYICLLPNTNLVKGFCPLKIKITQFPDGFRLKPLKETNLGLAPKGDKICLFLYSYLFVLNPEQYLHR